MGVQGCYGGKYAGVFLEKLMDTDLKELMCFL